MKLIKRLQICLLKHRLFAVLMLANSLFMSAVMAAQISVTTDRNPVSIDESFRITFSTSESPSEDPDFSPLEQDFDILSQSSSSNSSWINGQSTKTLQWTLNVMAKQAGNLTIPPIKFGNDSSETANILVTQAGTNKDIKTDEDLFLEVDAKPESPFVQSQVVYTLKLFTRVQIAQARLNEPELPDAVIEKLGDDSNYRTQINGFNYAVTERKYAIFPQKSGQMTIKSLSLTAEIISNSRPNFNGFFSPQMAKTKRVDSKSITLNVKPAPDGFSGNHWLAAEELHLKQEWSGDIDKMKVGEPLTRTLTLLAKGTTVGQLPELHTAKADDQLKAYPDQPVLQEQKKPDGIIAFREEKIALIPSKAGNYVLPAIEIPWFNTQTQKMEIAKIPETTLSATSVAGLNSSEAPPVVKQDTPKTAEPIKLVQPSQQPSNIWLGISIMLAFGWLATLIYFLTKRPGTQTNLKSKADEIAATNLKSVIDNLKKACHDNDAVAAKDSLIAWGRQQLNVSNLGALAALCDEHLQNEILHLNQILYGKEPSQQWQGKKLYEAFTENKTQKKSTRIKPSELEPLYRL
jgi:hypothetical protein